METIKQEQAPYIASSSQSNLKVATPAFRWTTSNFSDEEDSRQDIRVRFEEEDSEECFRECLGESIPQQNYLRESIPSIPQFENEDDGSEKLNFSIRRCQAWSQDSFEPHIPGENTTAITRYERRDSMLIDEKYGGRESLEKSPTSITCVYWEEKYDYSTEFKFGGA